jgi:acetoin utilization deacetylase AcuC-like enzyme
VSFHHYGPGIYPGTGNTSQPTSINIPLKAGLTDTTFCKLYTEITEMFNPDITVLCAGADGMIGDPLGDWQLELRSFLHVARSFKKGLVLGGGRLVSV